MGFFPRFHRWQNREGKSLCRYSRKKKRLSRLYNQGVKKKEENWPFLQRGLVHAFAQKMTFFPRFYLWQNRHWNKKTPFEAIKTKNSNTRKIDISQKGITDGFGPEMAIFPTFLFRQYRPGKCF